MPASTYALNESLDIQRELLLALLRATATTQAKLVEGTGVQKSHLSPFLRNTPGTYIAKPKLRVLFERLGWLPDGRLDPGRVHLWSANAGLVAFLNRLAPDAWFAQAVLPIGRTEVDQLGVVAAWVGNAPVLIRDDGRGIDRTAELQLLLWRSRQVDTAGRETMPAPCRVDEAEFAAWEAGTIGRARFAEAIAPSSDGVPSAVALPREWRTVVEACRGFGLTAEDVLRIVDGEIDFRCLTDSEIENTWFVQRRTSGDPAVPMSKAATARLRTEIAQAVEERRRRAITAFGERAATFTRAVQGRPPGNR